MAVDKNNWRLIWEIDLFRSFAKAHYYDKSVHTVFHKCSFTFTIALFKKTGNKRQRIISSEACQSNSILQCYTFFRLIFVYIYIIASQFSPLKPVLHLHQYLDTPSIHFPPFWQGFEQQSSKSVRYEGHFENSETDLIFSYSWK